MTVYDALEAAVKEAVVAKERLDQADAALQNARKQAEDAVAQARQVYALACDDVQKAKDAVLEAVAVVSAGQPTQLKRAIG